MKREELRKELSALNKEITELKQKERELLKQDREFEKDELRKCVGRAFRTSVRDNKWIYAFIFDVPQEIQCMTHVEFNSSQLPALFIDETEDELAAQIYEDTFFVGSLPENGKKKRFEYDRIWDEITQEAFWNFFTRKMEDMRVRYRDRAVTVAGSAIQKRELDRLSGGWLTANQKLADDMVAEMTD